MNAVLYIPTGMDLWKTLSRLGAHAEGNGWTVGCYTRDWTEVVQLIGTDQYQLGVIPSITMLDPARLPRIVAMDQPEPTMPPRPRWRR